jgi:hypothetical protein
MVIALEALLTKKLSKVFCKPLAIPKSRVKIKIAKLMVNPDRMLLNLFF